MKHSSLSIPPEPDPTEQEIQHAAYMLWVEEGRPDGRDIAHWHSAREMLRHRHGRDVRDARRRHHKEEAEA